MNASRRGVGVAAGQLMLHPRVGKHHSPGLHIVEVDDVGGVADLFALHEVQFDHGLVHAGVVVDRVRPTLRGFEEEPTAHLTVLVNMHVGAAAPIDLLRPKAGEVEVVLVYRVALTAKQVYN